MRDAKERYRSSGHDRHGEFAGFYAQVRPSSGLRYPRLEMDRWYPVRREDELGCFIDLGNAEMYVERGHYLTREGKRGADRSRGSSPAISMETKAVVEELARGA